MLHERDRRIMSTVSTKAASTAAGQPERGMLSGEAPLEKVALETYVPPAKPSLIGLSRTEISDRLAAIGVAPAQRKMRTQQLWHWMYVRGAKSFDEMTSVSKEMRAELEKHVTVDRPEVVAEQISNDGTRKWLLRLPSGDNLEKAHEVAVKGSARIFIVDDLNPRALSPRLKGFVQAQSWYQDLTPIVVSP